MMQIASSPAAVLSTPFVIIAWLAVVTAIVLAVVYGRRARLIRTRLEEEHATQLEPLAPVPTEEMSWLRRWLFVAGFRRPSALSIFLAAAMAAFLVGLAVALVIATSTRMFQLRVWLYDLPGRLGWLLDPLFLLAPWVLGLIIACVPWLYVRAVRRRRVRQIEEDLPITLQLLATLARAGLGLDAAMVRVLEASDTRRPLSRELITFRRENMAGLPRVSCWRRLGRRIDIASMSIFVSAMVHAEQVGGGISGVLDHQAEDVQSRRREQALIRAHALPVKLVFPLVICFLPGIFIWTLGPVFYRFLEMIGGLARGAA